MSLDALLTTLRADSPMTSESDNSSCKPLDDAEDANQPEWAVRRRRKRILTREGTKSILSAPVELKNKNCHYCEHAPKRCSNFTCLSPKCDQVHVEGGRGSRG